MVNVLVRPYLESDRGSLLSLIQECYPDIAQADVSKYADGELAGLSGFERMYVAEAEGEIKACGGLRFAADSMYGPEGTTWLELALFHYTEKEEAAGIQLLDNLKEEGIRLLEKTGTTAFYLCTRTYANQSSMFDYRSLGFDVCMYGTEPMKNPGLKLLLKPSFIIDEGLQEVNDYMETEQPRIRYNFSEFYDATIEGICARFMYIYSLAGGMVGIDYPTFMHAFPGETYSESGQHALWNCREIDLIAYLKDAQEKIGEPAFRIESRDGRNVYFPTIRMIQAISASKNPRHADMEALFYTFCQESNEDRDPRNDILGIYFVNRCSMIATYGALTGLGMPAPAYEDRSVQPSNHFELYTWYQQNWEKVHDYLGEACGRKGIDINNLADIIQLMHLE